MAVPEHKRKESKLYAYDVTFNLVHNIIVDFTNSFMCEARELGLTNGDGTPKMTSRENTEYLMRKFRSDLVNNCTELLTAVSKASAIYPVRLWEVEEKRKLQDEAIMMCSAVETSINLLVRMFPMMLHCLEHYTKELHGVIVILQKWRKSNSVIIRTIKKKDKTSPTYEDLRLLREVDEQMELEKLASKEKEDNKKQRVAFTKSPVAEIVDEPVKKKKVKKIRGDVPVVSKDTINKDTLSDTSQMKKVKMKKIAGGN